MKPQAVSHHHAMTLLLSVQRQECRFPPLRDKRSYRRIRTITLALPLKERTHAHTPLYGPHLQNFRLLMRCMLVFAEAPVHFLFSALTGVTIALLQAPYELVPFSCNA